MSSPSLSTKTVAVVMPGLNASVTLTALELTLCDPPPRDVLDDFLYARDPRTAYYCHAHAKFYEKQGSFQNHLERHHSVSKHRAELLMLLDIIWKHERVRSSTLPHAASATDVVDLTSSPPSSSSPPHPSSSSYAPTAVTSQVDSSPLSGSLATSSTQISMTVRTGLMPSNTPCSARVASATAAPLDCEHFPAPLDFSFEPLDGLDDLNDPFYEGDWYSHNGWSEVDYSQERI
ncbi:hypothetical protein FH972_021113 [Carpinus fangiana]|uniref:Uncharacterized protein n=1 Tax=Carpinus fangiana TaxID=176857 RepID=A0A5N6KNK4_9ROSI|nr:hypothetical protein FH972_021113 [Carpinus fangiana]